MPDWITDGCSITNVDGQKIILSEFFGESCQQFSTSEEKLKTRFAIYYLVVRHQGYGMADNRFTNESEVQIYIGRAQNGVKERWTDHCRAVEKVLAAASRARHLSDMIDRCEPYQLVDVFVALAHLQQFKMALFLVKTCDSSRTMKHVEGDFIRFHSATNIRHGLNCKEELK